MHSVIKILEMLLTNIVEICTILLELFGVAILVFTAIKSFWYWIKQDARIRLDLAQGIALSLEFKMGSEVLRTVIGTRVGGTWYTWCGYPAARYSDFPDSLGNQA